MRVKSEENWGSNKEEVVRSKYGGQCLVVFRLPPQQKTKIPHLLLAPYYLLLPSILLLPLLLRPPLPFVLIRVDSWTLQPLVLTRVDSWTTRLSPPASFPRRQRQPRRPARQASGAGAGRPASPTADARTAPLRSPTRRPRQPTEEPMPEGPRLAATRSSNVRTPSAGPIFNSEERDPPAVGNATDIGATHGICGFLSHLMLSSSHCGGHYTILRASKTSDS